MYYVMEITKMTVEISEEIEEVNSKMTSKYGKWTLT